MGIGNDASNDQGSNVYPLRRPPSTAPNSSVMPVARKVSGSTQIDPLEHLGRLALKLVESAIDNYHEARKSREHGDDASADIFKAAANRAMSVASEAIEELAET